MKYLVIIEPTGTGFSRLLARSTGVRLDGCDARGMWGEHAWCHRLPPRRRSWTWD